MNEKNKQVTWGGRFKGNPSELMLEIGESVSFDHRLALYDIEGSRAHASMLKHVGILTQEELEALHQGLDQIAETIQSGTFKWDKSLEDVHMNIEQALTQLVQRLQNYTLHVAVMIKWLQICAYGLKMPVFHLFQN
jgi:argininosuccinate lyase